MCNVPLSPRQRQAAKHRAPATGFWLARGFQRRSFVCRTRCIVLLFWLFVFHLFISQTDRGSRGLDPSPRMRSRRKRVQRAACAYRLQPNRWHSSIVTKSIVGITGPQAQRLWQPNIWCYTPDPTPHHILEMLWPCQPHPGRVFPSQLHLFMISSAEIFRT